MFPPKTVAKMRPSAGAGGVSTMPPEKVIVAVKAGKVISKTALAWALTHVVHPGDCIMLLAVFFGSKTGKKFWSFPRFTGECRSSDRTKLPERIGQISESCSQMVLQLHEQIEVRVRIKVASSTPPGSVAAEAKSSSASWVILDKKLKQERKHCLEELQCNIVLMRGSQPKVLRLNFSSSNEPPTPFFSASSSPLLNGGKLWNHRMRYSTPASSPEEPSTTCHRLSMQNSLSSPDITNSVFLVYEKNPLFEGVNRGKTTPIYNQTSMDVPCAELDSDGEDIVTLSPTPKSYANGSQRIFWMHQNHIVDEEVPLTSNSRINPLSFNTQNFVDKFVSCHRYKTLRGPEMDQISHKDYTFDSSIREAVSLGRTSSIPPPLCSLCQHKAPAFGKPPRQLDYEELEEATDGFSDINLLAEGGFGLVHKGVLRDGLVVAVKQLKFVGSHGDADFCREVRVLSCAQHRNVVSLIGFCVERNRRVLVYEYICNGSLEFHLHGGKTCLDWPSRLKIAIGTARGLRYLHEDCRVGCIVHRDMRPSNILVTHDFEPLVSDFGLVRLHREWDACEIEQVAGISGYLAPEYFDGGSITEKVDIYAFGLVLLELITGQKRSDLQCNRGQQFLSEISYPFSTSDPLHLLAWKYQLIDPCLGSYSLHNLPHELQAMGCAASLCLQKDLESRPHMSKVLTVLEGGETAMPLFLDLRSVGTRSGHMQGLNSKAQPESQRKHSRRLSH